MSAVLEGISDLILGLRNFLINILSTKDKYVTLNRCVPLAVTTKNGKL